MGGANGVSTAPGFSNPDHDVDILVVGAGPVGLITALQLAHHGVRCMLVERNEQTTRWPKMDITNCRTMELFRTLGLAGALRKIGVPGNYSFDVLVSTGLGERGERITKWDLPSPDEWQKRIARQNDGTMPREPYQRCSQIVFEAWLKPICEANPLIDTSFGMKFETLLEKDDAVFSTLTDAHTGKEVRIRSKYVIACDGAGSRVRRSAGLKLTGGPLPHARYLVHFRSRDLSKLHSQGQFWHIFFTGGGVIINQDEIDTWTVHCPIPLEQDVSALDPKAMVYKVLGSQTGPCPIEIDEVLVTSVYRPNLVVADTYRTEGGRIFLAGDSAHQNVPTGGYGMNMGVGDAYDIGWKLAAMIKGYGGPHLLDSYEIERRPVALRNVNRSGEHASVHMKYVEWVKGKSPEFILSNEAESLKFKSKIRDFVLTTDGENKDHGLEMGYRHDGSPVVCSDEGGPEPPWSVRDYVASTWPGSRAPHVFLEDGTTSIFDLYGLEYTIVDFTPSGALSREFATMAGDLNVPLKRVHLPHEPHVRKIWERDVVLVRPDGHVAWRCPSSKANNVMTGKHIEEVLMCATGRRCAPSARDSNIASEPSSMTNVARDQRTKITKFAATVGDVEQDAERIRMMGAFQT